MTLKLVAFDLHIKGVSLRDIRNHIWQIYGINKPVSTLHRWIVKLMGIMQEALSNVKPEVGNKWLGDEMVVRVNGQVRYLWNIMDYGTRVHLVSILTEGRGATEALMIIRQAIQEAGKNPQKFITDGLSSYSKALNELQNNRIVHVYNVGLTRQEDNNNRLERLHGTVRSWVKTQRGLKGKSQELFNVRRLYYNSIRPHMALQDKTPAKTDKDGRWLSFMIDKNKRKQMNASD
jgi:transposase-like protein